MSTEPAPMDVAPLSDSPASTAAAPEEKKKRSSAHKRSAESRQRRNNAPEAIYRREMKRRMWEKKMAKARVELERENPEALSPEGFVYKGRHYLAAYPYPRLDDAALKELRKQFRKNKKSMATEQGSSKTQTEITENKTQGTVAIQGLATVAVPVIENPQLVTQEPQLAMSESMNAFVSPLTDAMEV